MSAFLEDYTYIRVTVPSGVGTDDTLTVSIQGTGADDLDLPETWEDSLPLITVKQTSAGLGKVIDETIVITAGDLIITEGASGLLAGDQYFIRLTKPSTVAAEATAVSS